MAALVYSAIASLDGYVSDEDGGFDWAGPDPQVHAFVNDLERPIGTYLYGRRMYETMRYWDTAGTTRDLPPYVTDYAAIWRAAEKVVFSRSLPGVSTARTRLERAFDPDAIRALKEHADADVSIGGPDLAAEAIRAGLVDEYRLFLHPVLIGGGAPALPAKIRIALQLQQERRFDGGVVFLRYRARS